MSPALPTLRRSCWYRMQQFYKVVLIRLCTGWLFANAVSRVQSSSSHPSLASLVCCLRDCFPYMLSPSSYVNQNCPYYHLEMEYEINKQLGIFLDSLALRISFSRSFFMLTELQHIGNMPHTN